MSLNQKQFSVYIPPERLAMAREAIKGKTRFRAGTEPLARAVARTSLQPEHFAKVKSIHTGIGMPEGQEGETHHGNVELNMHHADLHSHARRQKFDAVMTHEIGHANDTVIQGFSPAAEAEGRAENFREAYSNSRHSPGYDSFTAADWQDYGDGSRLKNYRATRKSGELPGDGPGR